MFAASVPGTRAIAQPRPQRREVSGLPMNDPILETLRDGVRILQNRQPGQGPTWTDMANIHGTDQGFNKCPHGNWYFLPWHRAYVRMYEQMIRSITSNAAFAMPYWDWAANRAVPQAFSQPTYNGAQNPLYVADRRNDYRVPDIYAGPEVMADIYGQRNFELFATSRPRGQTDLNPAWIKRGGVQGTLERTPHNNIHNDLKGWMPTTRSPMDPIFQMHHANIDRIWWQWNARGGVNTSETLWRDMPFTDNYYNPDGTMATYRPADLLDVEALGYSYGAQPRRVGSGLRTRADVRLATIFRVGRAASANVPGTERLIFQETPFALGIEGAAAVRGSNLSRALGEGGSGAPPPPPPLMRGSEGPSQVVALIHNLTPPTDDVEVLVFAGTGALPEATDVSSPNFVTSIGFFGGGGHNHEGISASVDLTQHLRTLPARSDEVHVRLVARPKAGGNASVQETVARAEVEVVIV
ncbi:MAG TPA: tyrosinase family protein [Allosphingosinicella sp.]|jgi:tyrosinase